MEMASRLPKEPIDRAALIEFEESVRDMERRCEVAAGYIGDHMLASDGGLVRALKIDGSIADHVIEAMRYCIFDLAVQARALSRMFYVVTEPTTKAEPGL